MANTLIFAYASCSDEGFSGLLLEPHETEPRRFSCEEDFLELIDAYINKVNAIGRWPERFSPWFNRLHTCRETGAQFYGIEIMSSNEDTWWGRLTSQGEQRYFVGGYTLMEHMKDSAFNISEKQIRVATHA